MLINYPNKKDICSAQGQYLRKLAEIILHSATDEDYLFHKNIDSCEILTEQDLNSFVAYREVENEKDLSQLVTLM